SKRALRPSDLDVSLALTKVERFPRELHTGGTAPDTVIGTRAEHGTRNRRHDRLRQHETEDVVGRRAILLPQQVKSREVRRSRDVDPFVGGLRASATFLDRGIVLERELDGVVQ